MKRAVRDVILYGKSKKSVSRDYNIPRQTLCRHVQKAEKAEGVQKLLGRKTVMTVEQESELSRYLQDMEASLYGLTPLMVRQIVFKFCEKNHIPHNFNCSKEAAGKNWFKKFMAHCSELSVRSPEPVSIHRAIGFNDSKVAIFLNLLEKTLFTDTLDARKIPPENVFNVDETGFSIAHKPHKIVAKRGKKSVGALTSAERGKNTTVVCCFSAAGEYVPPFIIFPRVNMKHSLMDNAQ